MAAVTEREICAEPRLSRILSFISLVGKVRLLGTPELISLFSGLTHVKLHPGKGHRPGSSTRILANLKSGRVKIERHKSSRFPRL